MLCHCCSFFLQWGKTALDMASNRRVLRMLTDESMQVFTLITDNV